MDFLPQKIEKYSTKNTSKESDLLARIKQRNVGKSCDDSNVIWSFTRKGIKYDISNDKAQNNY